MRSTRQLASGDLPTRALLGTLADSSGGRGSFGNDYYTPQFGGGYSPSFGSDYGADAMAMTAPPPPPPPPAQFASPGRPMHTPNPHDPRFHAELMAAWHRQHGRREHTARRLALLSPNEHSDVKVEAYIFSVNPSQFSSGTSLVWGSLNGWTAYKNPQVAFRAERVFVNVNLPGLVYVNTIQAANVNAQIGGIADAFTFSPLAQGSKISLPTLPPQNTMQVTGTWTNIVPTPYNNDTVFTLAIDFEGWATVIA
jgi:hypothetical protein